METTPRRTRSQAAKEPADKPLVPPGPWCPLCGHEHGRNADGTIAPATIELASRRARLENNKDNGQPCEACGVTKCPALKPPDVVLFGWPKENGKVRGPWCRGCQHEYPPKDRQQAALAMSAGLKLKCPGCHQECLVVAGFDETAPELGKGDDDEGVTLPKVHPDVAGIIESVFQVDYAREWRRLHDVLTVGDGRTDHGSVNMALDKAEDNARLAHKLWVNLKIELERYKVDAAVTQAAMRNEANESLQEEKDGGKRSKQITDADVASKMAELHPDEYRTVELQLKRFELSVEHAKDFAERWNQKCRDLNTMLAKLRGGGVT